MFIVQKYGGQTLCNAEDIKKVAQRIAEMYKKKIRSIVVVSAMGNTTDQLMHLAHQVSSMPSQRELDMLLTTGERISMALLSMALNDLGVPAISFTGSQAGVLTDDCFNNARIIDLRPSRIQEALDQNKVVVLAGFQGVSPKTKEITTLGRGGSDTTAVAMAAYFRADRCEILKDVNGIYSADPKLIGSAQIIPEMTYRHLTEMTFWGAKFLHHRAAELAQILKVPIYIGPSHTMGRGTLINGDSPMYENEKILSVNSHAHVKEIRIKASNLSEALEQLQNTLNNHQLPMLQILHSQNQNGCWQFLVAGSPEHIQPLGKIFNSSMDFATVTATCLGLVASDTLQKLSQRLQSQGIKIYNVIVSPLSVGFLLEAKDREQAIKVLSHP